MLAQLTNLEMPGLGTAAQEKQRLILRAILERGIALSSVKFNISSLAIHQMTGIPERTVRYHLDALARDGLHIGWSRKAREHVFSKGRWVRRAGTISVRVGGPVANTSANTLAAIYGEPRTEVHLIEIDKRAQARLGEEIVKDHGQEPLGVALPSDEERAVSVKPAIVESPEQQATRLARELLRERSPNDVREELLHWGIEPPAWLGR